MMRVPDGLTARTARLLLLAFVAMQVAVLALLWWQVVRPLAQQSADDLAGRLVLAAQTWVELPPETRQDFEVELAGRHGIHISRLPLPQGAAAGGLDALVATALQQRLGTPVQVIALDRQRAGFGLTMGGHALSLSYARPQALGRAWWTLASVMLFGGLVTVLLALWLTRRIAERLRRLAAHAAQVGQGGVPEPLPETGEAELAALTAQMNRLAGEVQALLENRTVLLAGISHDLRTPLTRIRLALSLLEEVAPERVARMTRDVHEMDALIGDMLALARDLRTEVPAEIDWPTWLAGFAARWPADAVQCRVQGAVPTRVATAALGRILGNLVENALNHAGAPVEVTVRVGDLKKHEGPPRVFLGPLRGETSGASFSGWAQTWQVAVEDRGPGIPADQREAVFRPFYRLEASRTRTEVGGGAGLGLAVARQLAQAQGWRIQLADRPGGGLTAVVSAPGHQIG